MCVPRFGLGQLGSGAQWVLQVVECEVGMRIKDGFNASGVQG